MSIAKKNKSTLKYKAFRIDSELLDKIMDFQIKDNRPSFTNAAERLIELGLKSLKDKALSTERLN
jgi:hypothetical protein